MSNLIPYEDYSGAGVFVPQFCTDNCPDRQTFEDWLFWAIKEFGEDFEAPEVYPCEDQRMELNAELILEHALELAQGDFSGDFDLEWDTGTKELEEFLVAWNDRHGVRHWIGMNDGQQIDISNLIARLRAEHDRSES